MDIICNHITKSFSSSGKEHPQPLYQDFSRSVKSGEFVGIMGPSGSGKSTILNMIAGIESIQAGEIIVGGQIVSPYTPTQRTNRRGKTINFIFQQFCLIPYLTVAENVDLVIDIVGAKRQYATMEILDLVGLAQKAHHYPANLSGGEQQRVGIARAFVAKKPIILADEPTANLDYETAHQTMTLMRTLHDENNRTTIVISHDKDIMQYTDKRYTIRGGQMTLSSV